MDGATRVHACTRARMGVRACVRCLLGPSEVGCAETTLWPNIATSISTSHSSVDHWRQHCDIARIYISTWKKR